MGKKTLALISTLFLCIILTRAGTVDAQASTIAVIPASQTIALPGQLFSVDITITSVPASTQYIINNITWDPNIIELEHGTEADIIQGPFLGGAIFLVTISATPGQIDEVTEARLTGTKSGSGILFTINFRSKAAGVTQVKIGFAIFYSGLLPSDIPNVNNATVTVTPEFPASMLLPLFLTATSIVLIVATVWSRKRRSHIKVP